MGCLLGSGRRVGDDLGGVLHPEAVVAMDEGRGVCAHPVVGTAPRREIEFARLAGDPAPGELLQQLLDDLRGQRPLEELRLDEAVASELLPRRLPLCRLPRGALPPEAGGLLERQVLEEHEVWLRSRSTHQRFDQVGRVRFRAEHDADHTDGGRLLDVGAGPDQQARRQLLRGGRRPRLPGVDRRGCLGGGPRHVEVRRGWRWDGPERERGHHAEVAGTGSAERPEQILFVMLVALDDPAVRQDDLRPEQVVGCQPVPSPDDPEPSPEREPGDPDGGQDPAGMARSCWSSDAYTSPILVPPPTVTEPPETSTACIRVTSTRSPPLEERPPKQCPPPRVPTSIPCVPANRMTSATSSGLVHRTIASGWTSSNRALSAR